MTQHDETRSCPNCGREVPLRHRIFGGYYVPWPCPGCERMICLRSTMRLKSRSLSLLAIAAAVIGTILLTRAVAWAAIPLTLAVACYPFLRLRSQEVILLEWTCPNCEYDLRGLPPEQPSCPECGKALERITADDEST